MEANQFNAVVAHAASALPTLSAEGIKTALIIGNLQASEQAVVSAVALAADDATIVGPSGQAITTFHQRLYDVAFESAQAVSEAYDNQQQRLQIVIASQYGKTCPTYKQFQADRAALKTLAAFRGLVDDQWLRKPYNAAVKTLYGALPVAMTAAAIVKRAQRDAAPKPAATPVGAPKNVTAVRDPSASEQAEQLIAKIGVFETMKAIAAILKAEAATATDAKALEAIAAHYKAA